MTLKPTLSNHLLALLISTLTFASPLLTDNNPLAALQCYCLTFSPPHAPTVCTYPDNANLDWPSALTLASTHALSLEFASDATRILMLRVEQPLPASALLGTADATSLAWSGSKVVCGVSDEVQRKWMRGGGGYLKEEEEEEVMQGEAYMSKVLAVLQLIVIVYAVGEYVYLRFLRGGRIRLGGAEKSLITGAMELDPEPAPKSRWEDTDAAVLEKNYPLS